MYERDDYLLIRDDKVIAVSGNTDFDDGEHSIVGQKTDTVVLVVSNGDEIAYLAAKEQFETETYLGPMGR